MTEEATEKTIRYLNDSYAAEIGGIHSLEALVASVTDTDLKAAAAEHLEQTRSQARRLEARIKSLGGTVNEAKSFLDSIVSMGSHLVNIFHDKEDKQTQDLIKACALEEFEVCAYTALASYTEAVGDEETALLARQILSEEKTARERMEALVPQVSLSALNKTSATGGLNGAGAATVMI